jgi:hypothetical protein
MEDFSVRFRINITLAELEFKLNSEQVCYGLKCIDLKDVVSIKYGWWAPPRISRAHYFHFKQRDGKVMEVGYNSFVYDPQTMANWYAQFETKLMEVYGNHRIVAMHEQLKAGQEVKFETCVATQNGLQFSQRKWFKTHNYLVPWEKVGFKEGGECSVMLGDIHDSEARFEFRYGPEWDGQFFMKYLQILKKSPKMLAELRK